MKGLTQRISSRPWVLVTVLILAVGQIVAAQEDAAIEESSSAAVLPPDEVQPRAGLTDSPPVDLGSLEALSYSDIPEVFSEAVEFYDEAAYADAVRHFSQLARSLDSNAAAHYNLGNALLRNGELGLAIASYRKAQSLAPRDQDIAANLQFARNSTKDALAPPEPGAVVRTLLFWHHSLSLSERVFGAVLLGLMFWTALALWLLRRARSVAGWTVALAGPATALLLVSAVVTWASGQPHGVVVPAEIDALTGPRNDGVVRFKIHAGTEVRVIEERSSWLRIQLSNGERGWVEEAFVARGP